MEFLIEINKVMTNSGICKIEMETIACAFWLHLNIFGVFSRGPSQNQQNSIKIKHLKTGLHCYSVNSTIVQVELFYKIGAISGPTKLTLVQQKFKKKKEDCLIWTF